MAKIIILENNGGRLANQLWQFASVRAYCLENGFECENYSFFRYQHYFNFKIKNRFVYLVFFRPVVWLGSYRVSKLLYKAYVGIKKIFCLVVYSSDRVMLLPPSPPATPGDAQVVEAILASSKNKKWYFSGWLFRNSVGMKKYYAKLNELFRPKEECWAKICGYVDALRSNHKMVIGVHIRRGDYKVWQNGNYLYNDQEVRTMLLDFLKKQNYKAEDVCFMMCSDEQIDLHKYEGLSRVLGPGGEVGDLFALSRTDLIIGSHSTYGWWAAYYGSVPFIEFSRKTIDWEKDKEYNMEHKMTL